MEGIDCFFSCCDNFSDIHICASDFCWMFFLYLFIGSLVGINFVLPLWNLLKAFLLSVYHWFVFILRGLHDEAELSQMRLAREKAAQTEKEAP